jgi:endonuclease/exonuclease/phosphatase family metal-dependent hydrolase
MSGKTRLVFALLILLLVSCRERIEILCYNVENLFDDRSDGREYPEYRQADWNGELYARKLSAIARVLKAASARGADIVLLQEVESRKALLDLRDRHLAALGYRYLVLASQEGLATTVGCLSRVPIGRTVTHSTGWFEGLPLRPILEMRFELDGAILYLFNNHWKSKTEGAEATEQARRQAARVLAERIGEVLQTEPDADLLVVGDLNENLDELQQAGGRYATAVVAPELGRDRVPPQRLEQGILFVSSNVRAEALRDGRLVLYDAWFEIPEQRRGSSVYRGAWQTHDRMLLSAGLFDERGFRYRPGSFRVLRESFLLEAASGFPKRWRRSPAGGPDGGWGYSDHLPLVIRLEAPR